ncbi:MAG TPA: alpha-1,4-glucan--maltose-1-phosphate maltosyltransferase [Nitrospira sp.]|jgi:starch synthase (maltosyl-transferring)|nr:alpha-1,4-glucan--maltose-1-phosphate maltosyltransferase [Nitrospira sp.]
MKSPKKKSDFPAVATSDQPSTKRRSLSDVGGLVDGRCRVVIEEVRPEIDGGRFPIKRVVGETVVVEADVFADGHDEIAGALRYRHEREQHWTDVPLVFLQNDRWRASFEVLEQGLYYYTVIAWIDRFRSWQRDMRKRVTADQDVTMHLLVGRDLIKAAALRAAGMDAEQLNAIATAMEQDGQEHGRMPKIVLEEKLLDLMTRHADHPWPTVYDKELMVIVDRARAGFGAWYEAFPRSCASEPGRHGTFHDCEARLPYIAGMGFDVLYLPPVHPIGRTFRKGKNNDPAGSPDSVGSPWAIGASEGGHTAIHPDLGTPEDFRRLIGKVREHGMEIALDLAFQCSPDHPYVKQHPEWFVQRPDGTIQYAENPPKKYQDIYPLSFESDGWVSLWRELKEVVTYWIDQGVKIFRVDNPHTKPFAFWQWLIAEVKRDHPDVLFLSEAFTRPKVMYRLAKLGFTQSYTYFAWRQTKWELTQYFTELAQTDVRECFRPNLWPNTPDILTEQLQHGGRAIFMSRFILAATLGANYGIYGPAFELMESRPLKPGSEEYLDSEKYEIRTWDWDRADSLKELICRVNRIRRENAAFHNDASLVFHHVDNDELIAYSKRSVDGENVTLTVVNLSPHYIHSGWLQLNLEALGVEANTPFQAVDLLTDAYYTWQGARNYVQIDPHSVPAHIFVIRRHLRTERDFDYFI